MWRSERMIQNTIDGLAAKGVNVTRVNLPGLYQIEGGPEITVGQLLDLARQRGVVASADHPRS